MTNIQKMTSGERMARRIVYLAWLACGGPIGLGVLQDRGHQNEAQVWEAAAGATDYPSLMGGHGVHDQKIYCDYVLGRMMKMTVRWDDKVARVVNPREIDRDYNAWGQIYRTARDLERAAVESLEEETQS